jgi:ribonucleoside-diphosphate reductase alpha chain
MIRNPDGTFAIERFKSAVDIMITAQDILVSKASYPTQKIARNSYLYRPLGLGYANLGAFLMSMGMPYDSDQGRELAASVTALMHMEAYAQSARLAQLLGPFDRYEANKESMLDVMHKHRRAIDNCPLASAETMAALRAGDLALELGERYGYRNAQVTVLAPTGTIGFMMDCDTTGVEPDLALVKYKLMASGDTKKTGGVLKIVNRTVPMALKELGYDDDAITAIVTHISNTDTIEGAPGLKSQHLAVFDCAFKPKNGVRCIDYTAHIKMMAAVQPFLSGAISKTVNVPSTATVEDIMGIYYHAWALGLKAVAIYRDGSKRSQPVTVSAKTEKKAEAVAESAPSPKLLTQRDRMPSTRRSITHKFEIGNHEGYVTLGFYPDNRLGELFVVMAKEGSTIRGLMDCWSTAVSIGLQYGVPFEVYLSKFKHTRFDPSGWCNGGSPIKSCSSLPDYIFRWTDLYLKEHAKLTAYAVAYVGTEEEKMAEPAPAAHVVLSQENARMSDDAPPCDQCGAITVRNGACFKCNNCGNSLGCS